MTRLQLCRRDSSLPESVSGLAVNKKYIVTVRNSGVVEIFSNPYLFKISSLDTGMRDVHSAEFDGDTLVINSLSEGILYLDMATFTIRKDRAEGAWKVYFKNGKKMVIYSLVEGGSELHVNGALVYRSMGYILTACFGNEENSFLVGTHTGRFLHIKDGKVAFDIPLSSGSRNDPLTGIASVVGSEYAVTTMGGDLHIIDIDAKEIKQMIQVRNSSINGVCTIGNKILMIGADPRVICYSKTARYYAKEFQHDFHKADGLFIKECDGNIITVSEDRTINICIIPKIDRPISIKRYQDLPCSYSNGKMYSVTENEMRIYDVSKDKENSVLIFKHITKSPILGVEAVGDSCVIRTKEGIRVYEYNWSNSTVAIKKQIKGLVLYHTVIDGRVWYVISKKKLVLAVSSIENDGKTDAEWALDALGVDYIPSHISRGTGENSVLISGSDVVLFDFEKNVHRKISDKNIVYLMAVAAGERIHCAGQHNTTEIKDRSVLSVYSGDGEKIEDRELSFRRPLIDMQECEGSVFPVMQRGLKVIRPDNSEKNDVVLGPVVDGVKVSKNGIKVIQRPWVNASQKLPLQVLKEKYGRK
ncbi:hypothetical protein NEMIN01_1326 [Nematocida minor]|uniref:uncharacterized protein n=1 Tax=Nematocida minor TaxID=1912983 RepID=UPI002220C03A|nr:uncharacterized protein NEMIN01_1326 [Nematocida minor]KAI5190993.1 hypothetical protein NEMIN01_1326 [Nematocida minor]